MGAYIIQFDDKPWKDLDDELYYRCFEIPWFSTTKTTISRLTPYTEDSAYAHGYTEAESKYREIRDELEKQAYQRGYRDAMKKATDMLDSAFEKKFKNAGIVVKQDDRIIKCNGMMIPMQCKECRFGRVNEDSVECFVPDYDGVPVFGITKR